MDVWKILQARLSFLICSTHDTLPWPWNHHQWLNEDISSGCKIALSQGRYRWRHDQVLRKLAEVLEECRQGSKTPPPAEDPTIFVAEGGVSRSMRPRETPRPFSPDQEWSMRVYLDRTL